MGICAGGRASDASSVSLYIILQSYETIINQRIGGENVMMGPLIKKERK